MFCYEHLMSEFPKGCKYCECHFASSSYSVTVLVEVAENHEYMMLYFSLALMSYV